MSKTKRILIVNGYELDKLTVNGKEYDVNEVIIDLEEPINFE